ncbi:membrane protein [Litorimonas cladophorae]|uniref:Membrane protein n=1 Tax=Litorimonas cladophorae TaxID=1220491 RepID=A0A918NDZ2_9PROT|nr:GDYXXLXY domain-containing protein [Litorimonas cladophorae]GGX65444.1 membrane protein [Litorimonas cladophorae]
MSILRYGLIGLGALGIAGLFGSQIQTLETIKMEGETVLLDLRPVDPRALMMGDFMALAYAEEASRELPDDLPPSGQFVLTLDAKKVGRFARLADEQALENGEIRINYIRQRRGVTFGAPRYYFQNGTAEIYEQADYGIFRVSPSGRAILVGLADEDFKEIKPPSL